MNYKCITHGGGGIFSIFMDLVIPHLYHLKDIENIYIEVQDNEYNCLKNGFDYVFDQKCDETYKEIHCGFIRTVEVDERVKEICRKFKLKIRASWLYDLGIHYRGKDMNKQHKIYGKVYFKDYVKKINEVVKLKEIDNIFIASDNDEAIFKLGSVYIKNFYIDFNKSFRSIRLKDDTLKYQIKESEFGTHWEIVFKEMVSLSQCKYLICRRSNLSKTAIAFSNTITNIYQL